MSVGAVEFLPAVLPTAPVNATAPVVAWGRVGWVPPGEPLPPAVTSPPSPAEGRRRRRKRRRRRRESALTASAWDLRDGDRRAWAPWPLDLALNASGPFNASTREEFLASLNLTAEDVDYMWNISQKKRWGAAEGVGVHGHPIPNKTSCYCENTKSLLLRMVSGYQSLHPLAALTVCILGTLANALNVAVLTRPHLAPAPVNRILTAIAAADAALMAEYASYVIFVRLPQAKSGSGGGRDAAGSPPLTPAEEAARVERNFPFAAAAFVLFHTHFSQVMHTVSICLTLTLAVWRYLALRLPPERARILCSRRRCSVALAISVLLPPLLCTPSYILFGIDAREIRITPDTHPKYYQQVAAAAAHGAPSLTPDDFTIDPSLLIPTAAMASLDVDYGPGPASTLPSVSAALRQMAWAAAPPMNPTFDHDPAEEWEEEWLSMEEQVTTTPRGAFPHHVGPTRLPEVPPTAIAVAYVVELSKVARDKGEMLYIVNFWVYAVMLKLLPCLVLTVISVCLVRTLYRAKSRRRALQGDVKKAPAARAFPICHWRRKDKTALSKPIAASSRSAPPSAAPPEAAPPRRERPLDDGGVWMGHEETEPRPPDEEEAGEEVEVEEEEGATLVQEPSSRGAEDGEGARGNGAVAGAMADGGGGGVRRRREWLPGWLSLRRRRRGTSGDAAAQQPPDAVATVGAAVRRRRRRTERTTRMLVAVLILFLVTEFPQGVLGLMSGLLGRCFFQTCYHLFGDLMDLLALLNGSINFILYCAMSRQFRQTFAQLFCKHPKLLWVSLCKSCPSGHENGIEIMKNGNMGGEGLRKGATTVGGQPSQSMGEAQSTYV